MGYGSVTRVDSRGKLGLVLCSAGRYCDITVILRFCWNSISVSQKFVVDNNIVVARYIAMRMRMRTHPCAQATVKMESDREIESSETEMKTDKETFRGMHLLSPRIAL